MLCATDPSRDLLFGLLALQNGLIDQASSSPPSRPGRATRPGPWPSILVERGGPRRRRADAAVEAHGRAHLKKHGGDAEKSLAAIAAGRSTRESLAAARRPRHRAPRSPSVGSGSTRHDGDADRTASYAVGTATSDGQRFRVLRPHARGGLGAVFVALDAELHREVALKQILDHHADDPASRQRFLLEAEITGGLEHPGIVPVYGLGTYGDGRPYYAMRFIRGD